MSEFNITLVTSTGPQIQALFGLLARLPFRECKPCIKICPMRRYVMLIKTNRTLPDGSSTYGGGEAGIVFYASDGTDISQSFKLELLFQQ